MFLVASSCCELAHIGKAYWKSFCTSRDPIQNTGRRPLDYGGCLDSAIRTLPRAGRLRVRNPAVNTSYFSLFLRAVSSHISSHRGLLIHTHKVHQKAKSCGPNEEKKVCCQEADCSFKCQRLSQLREHLSQCHGFSFTEMVIQFDSADQFHDYLRKFERQNNVEFYINTANVNLKSKVVYYRCNRSGFYRVSKQVVQRRTKNQGSCKIEGHCTAYVKTKEVFATGRVTMQLCNSHYGHDLQLVHLRVPKEDKRIISNSLKRGLHFKEIIDEVIESKPQSAQRTNLIKFKDVYNVMAKEQKKKHQLQSCKNQSSSVVRLPKITKINRHDGSSKPMVESPPVPRSANTVSQKNESSLERLRENVLKNLQAMMDHFTCTSDEDILAEFLNSSNEWRSRLQHTNIRLVQNVASDITADDKIILVSADDLNFDVVDACRAGELSTSSFDDGISAPVINRTSSSESLDVKFTQDGRNIASIPSSSPAMLAALQRPRAECTLAERDAISSTSSARATCRPEPFSVPDQTSCEIVDLAVSEVPANNCFIASTICDPTLGYHDSHLPEVVPDCAGSVQEAASPGFVLVSSLDSENFDTPQILDRAFTTFSRDGETCFLHVLNELDDKDIQIVIA
ncbi:hypothetical protein FHG87_005160 [Trinorchestia longiramus]|nr:hypothetical protein FHG87_005160 [Trinorchestia longiramus]